MIGPGPEYIAARTALLDALHVLRAHRPALVVVGAQAVYLRTGTAGMTVAPHTTDGDVVLDPTLLSDEPRLSDLMETHGFTLKMNGDGSGTQPGQWERETEIGGRIITAQVDLIVPSDVLPGGKTRGARLPAHCRSAAMRTHGLEAALVDNGPVQISGFASDTRQTVVNIAGVAALLVAKVHKIHERVSDSSRKGRVVDKDAGDVLRLLRATSPATVARELERLAGHPISSAATGEALGVLAELFGSPRSPGVQMAVRATAFDLPPAQVEVQLTGAVRAIRAALG